MKQLDKFPNRAVIAILEVWFIKIETLLYMEGKSADLSFDTCIVYTGVCNCNLDVRS